MNETTSENETSISQLQVEERKPEMEVEKNSSSAAVSTPATINAPACQHLII